MTLDPHLRARTAPLPVQARAVDVPRSNVEVLADFERHVQGKLANCTIQHYLASLRDVLAYMKRDGVEIPVHQWTKEQVWEYVQHAQTNYCRFLVVTGLRTRGQVWCRKRVWSGAQDPAMTLGKHCTGCKVFEASQIGHKLNALGRFFKYLARTGVIRYNFVADIITEHNEDKPAEKSVEKRRNPSIEEMVRLVNGTTHPRNRAFYACSAKWWFRPNEMLILDRYASFQGHDKIPTFEEGGDLVHIPDVKTRDKRRGNRWSVIDRELRPILEQYFAWWERTVKRDASGKPLTTAMWLTDQGRGMRVVEKDGRLDPRFYDILFYKDTERLGLSQPADRDDSKKRWTAHCQRHFGEKLLQTRRVHPDWINRFRGDKIPGARDDYYEARPEDVRKMYLDVVPILGFRPLPNPGSGLSNGVWSNTS